MKLFKAFMTAILLLMALRIGGCSLETTQGDPPTTAQDSQVQQEQKAQK